jgi:hypothetical protein
MTRASMWHVFDRHPIKEFVEELTGVYPQDSDTLPDLFGEDEMGDDDELDKEASECSPMVYFLNEVEDAYGRDLPEELMLPLMTGELGLDALINHLDDQSKVAKITTQQERTRMRAYRIANKEKLRRSAKRRRRELKTGRRIARKRLGTAAGGYSFMVAPVAAPKRSASMPVPSSSGASPAILTSPVTRLGSVASGGWKLRWS